MKDAKVGDGVIYPTMSGNRHGTIVEIIPPHLSSSGLLIDFQDFDRNQGKTPDRMWLMRGDVEQAQPWSEAPPLRQFHCSRKSCYYHGNWNQKNNQTALPYCPNCHSEVEFDN